MPGLAVDRAARSPWVDRLARAGLVAKGVSFGIVALLAIEVALGRGGATTDRQGALRAVAARPFGEVLLVLLALGFAGYAIWRFTDAFLDRRDEGSDAPALAKRASFLARGCIYAGLCITTVRILAGSGGGGGSKEKQATGGVLDWPGGRWLVLAAAACVAGAAVWNAYRGLSRKFEEKLRRTSGVAVALGVAGHLARAVVFGVAAWFLAKAALQYDAHEAVGLDGALARLAHEAYGKALLGLVAAGLLAYGLYAVVEARDREV